MTDKYILINVTLPICLHLDSREFHIPYKKDSHITMASDDFFSNEYTYLGTAQNAEVISDSFSHFRFTKFSMKIPVFDETPIDPIKILEKYEKPFFKYLNIFIDASRQALSRYGLRNYYSYSDFIDGAHAESSEPENSRMSIGFSFPGGGISSRLPIRSNSDQENLQKLISNSIELPDRFLLDAKRDLYYNNYMYALLNSVISLEIVVADTLRLIAKSKGIDEKEINSFIQDAGLTGNIKSTLKLLTPSHASLPDDNVFSKCKTAITLRNKIMHRGLRDIPIAEIPEFIENIQIMITFCENLESEYRK